MSRHVVGIRLPVTNLENFLFTIYVDRRREAKFTNATEKCLRAVALETTKIVITLLFYKI